MSSKRYRDEDFGLKRSSGVDYSQVHDREIDDTRFARQKALRSGQLEPTVIEAKSATMDAFMRMVTGQEEKPSMAERLAGPSNRPTWEEFKKENGGKLAISAKQEEKEMLEYRKALDAERAKVLKRQAKKSKKRKSRHSSSEDDSSEDDERKKHKKKHKKHKKDKKDRKKRDKSADDE
ncbi:hypothetical protein SPRG_07196 [Saprolegnia parasitica CBS 223.65]|uniref:Uncharacterized protein n=1 Tax=Saprolegnia parasitica (strain CBS 223.65) TaxID=695850 RepID=A0A067CM69_SAPPC|nr:hypothetical protein SPRG_07196 [Saprolegnia parasitica CBS 223.65]KDO27922.1 hypothetical protein SPRG_07196 [Saprolegnia parasitica CBS 223.65]|eukprot:XP_012201378.1 hypothetical protein SPRG_07196 [Saprolegnia parasitica CBS 223.65]